MSFSKKANKSLYIIIFVVYSISRIVVFLFKEVALYHCSFRRVSLGMSAPSLSIILFSDQFRYKLNKYHTLAYFMTPKTHGYF